MKENLNYTDTNEKQEDQEEDEVPDLIPMLLQNQPPIHQPLLTKQENGKVPVVIITGYLGSGKTTLLKHILTADHGKRIAVVLNEFGDSLGIEKSDIQQEQSTKTDKNEPLFEDWVELRNGCLCCSVKDAGVKALENLVEKKRRENYDGNGGGGLDYIVLETTGLAHPGPIVSMFWLDPELESLICLDGLVTLVDGFNAAKRMKDEEGSEFLSQIAAADSIILNKLDLISKEKKDELVEYIKGINPFASVTSAVNSVVDLDVVFGCGDYADDVGKLKDKIEKLTSATSTAQHHSDLISSFCIELYDRRVNLERFEKWLESILWDDKTEREVIRFKGLIRTIDGQAFVYQGVSKIYDKTPLKFVSDETTSKLVFIGRFLDPQAIETSLLNNENCFST